MRPLNQLDNRSLMALKTALDEYQRLQTSSPELARPFLTIIESLVGSIAGLDIWAIRRQIQTEDGRRSRHATVKVVNPGSYDAVNRLSEREREVLRLIGEGHRSETIGDLLSISYRTLATHKANITAKLGLGSARDLVKFAHDNLTILN